MWLSSGPRLRHRFRAPAISGCSPLQCVVVVRLGFLAFRRHRLPRRGSQLLSGLTQPFCSGDWTANGLPSKKLQPRGVILVTRRDFSVPPASDTNAMARSRKPARAADNFTAAAYSVSEQKQAYGIPVDLQASNDATLQMVWGPGTFG